MTEMSEITSPFEEFIFACNEKRNKNIEEFSIQDEFKKLTPEEQTQILESIKNYQIGAAGKGEISSIDQFYSSLKALMGENTSFRVNMEESVIFNKSLITTDGEQDIEDYEEKQQKIKKEGDKYYVFSQGEYIEAEASVLERHPKFIELSFMKNLDLEQDFLRTLEISYYARCSRDNSLSAKELARFGMIHKITPDLLNDEDSSLQEFSLLYGVFKGKSSFLHLKINELSFIQLEDFIENMPEFLYRAYLELEDEKGRQAANIANPDLARIINKILDRDIRILENEPQNVHAAPVHNSANESMVRLLRNVLSSSGNLVKVSEDGRSVQLNHNKFRPFVDEQLKKLHQELKQLNALDEQGLYKSYLEPSLVSFEIVALEANPTKKTELIQYKKFQIEKAAALVEDVIQRGHTGNQYLYTFNVDAPDTNGMTVREMLAISYAASEDVKKLVRGGRNYEDLNKQDQQLCALEAKMKFLEGLYSIRRGYNLDHGIDDRETMTFSRQVMDQSVCQGGTVNRLVEALNGMNRDVEIRVFDVRVIKQRIQKISLKLINAYIDEKTADINTEMQLRKWKYTNKMPQELQSLIIKMLGDEITPENPFIKEFEKDFSYNDIIGNIARQAMDSYKFPEGIHKTSVIITKDDVAADCKQHVYSTDEKGNTALNIDLAIREDPEFIKTLLDQDFDLSDIYVPRNGKMLHIASDYLRYFTEIPDKLVTYIIEDPYSFREVFKELEANKKILLTEYAKDVITALFKKRDNVVNIIKLFPAEKRHEFLDIAKHAIYILAGDGKSDDIIDIIKFFPEENRHELIDIAKHAASIFIEKGDIYSVNNIRKIIKAFPEKNRNEFIDLAKHTISVLVEHGDGSYVANIIKLFPEEKRRQFLDIAQNTINVLFEKRIFFNVSNIISVFPEEMRIEFLDKVKHILNIMVEKRNFDYVSDFIKAFPEDKRHEFLDIAKHVLSILNGKGHSLTAQYIIIAFPEEKRIEFLDATKNFVRNYIFAEFVNNYIFAEQDKNFNFWSIKNIIKAFPEDKRREFLDIAIDAISTSVKNGNCCVVNAIIEEFPEEMSIELTKYAIGVFAENGEINDVNAIIGECPEEERIELAKYAIGIMANNEAVYYVSNIIEAFPEEKRYEFFDTAKHLISVLAKDGKSLFVADILKVFPEEIRHEFLDIAQDAINILAENRDCKSVGYIIEAFPEIKRPELLKFVTIACLDNDYSFEEIERVLVNSDPEMKLRVIKEILSEQVSQANFGKQAGREDSEGNISDLIKAMVEENQIYRKSRNSSSSLRDSAPSHSKKRMREEEKEKESFVAKHQKRAETPPGLEKRKIEEENKSFVTKYLKKDGSNSPGGLGK